MQPFHSVPMDGFTFWCTISVIDREYKRNTDRDSYQLQGIGEMTINPPCMSSLTVLYPYTALVLDDNLTVTKLKHNIVTAMTQNICSPATHKEYILLLFTQRINLEFIHQELTGWWIVLSVWQMLKGWRIMCTDESCPIRSVSKINIFF